MGWNTYHQVTTELDPGEWVYEEFTSYIFTHRELDSTEKIRFVKESPGEFIRSLKRQDGKDIWICGGADIVQQLMREDVKDLFLSVEWLSGNYPERLKKALDHCETVITAWDGDRLAGLINAIDDSELTAYVHYLCVDPAYQKCGIGKELLRRIKEKYSTYLYLILLAENEPLIEYYKQNGFEYMDGRYVFMVRNQ